MRKIKVRAGFIGWGWLFLWYDSEQSTGDEIPRSLPYIYKRRLCWDQPYKLSLSLSPHFSSCRLWQWQWCHPVTGIPHRSLLAAPFFSSFFSVTLTLCPCYYSLLTASWQIKDATQDPLNIASLFFLTLILCSHKRIFIYSGNYPRIARKILYMKTSLLYCVLLFFLQNSQQNSP